MLVFMQDVVVGKTRIDDLYGGTGSVYTPERHYILEHNHWFESVKRAVRDRGYSWWKDLFFFRNRWSGAYVVAMWTVPPNTGMGPGIFEPIEAINGHPNHDDGGEAPPSVEYMLDRLRPAMERAKEFRRIAAEQQYEVAADIERQQIMRKEAADYYRHEGKEDVARALNCGALPFHYTGKDEL